mgnify:CR=1 FL=1
MNDLLITIAVLGVTLFGVRSCADSEWYQASERETAAREARESTPHVVREADGCKVYAFKSGDRYHYFTRCPDSATTTESSNTVTCGKSCTRVETETITAQRSKE